MSPEAQRIAIAEACGWRYAEMCQWAPWVSPYDNMSYPILPDYLNDLDAMHETEKVLGSFEMPMDADTLPAKYSPWVALNATAAQRAEAFLRTLSLWDDSK